ncbi:hypothetical protein B0H14DRAFT_753131 [Mycena olivaceomarginata]|nr:hypothetical protein B0H14DRAFT_753131 [Mycena olivaceomarginata]
MEYQEYFRFTDDCVPSNYQRWGTGASNIAKENIDERDARVAGGRRAGERDVRRAGERDVRRAGERDVRRAGERDVRRTGERDGEARAHGAKGRAASSQAKRDGVCGARTERGGEAAVVRASCAGGTEERRAGVRARPK